MVGTALHAFAHPAIPYAFTAFGQYLSRRCRFTNLPVGVRRPAFFIVGLLRLLGIVMIGENRRIGEIDRADLARGTLLVVLVQYLHLADHGAADGATVGEPLLRGRNRDAVAFGAGVIFD